MIGMIAVVFVASAFVDFVWASYVVATSEKKAFKATLLSGVIVMIGAFVTLSYLEEKWLIVPAVVGGMLGTYISIKIDGK